jgi:hypothetical protein
MVQGKEHQGMKRSPKNNDGQDHQADERSMRTRMPMQSDLQRLRGHNRSLKIARISRESIVIGYSDAHKPFSTEYLIPSPSRVA